MDKIEIVKKRRVRKKVCEIDSYEKLKVSAKDSNLTTENETYPTDTREDINHTQISFGKFNITVKKTTALTPEELRKYYDEKFKINDSEKSAKLIVQTDSTVVSYDPIMEDEVDKKTTTKVSKKELNDQKIVSKKNIDKTNKILHRYINDLTEVWPKNTDVLCWWCCHNFDTCPVPCPVDYDNIRHHYKVSGVFCGWSCAAAWSIKEYSSITLLYQMKDEIGVCKCENNECTCEDITIAPNKCILKNFGGYMSIKDFRSIGKNKKILVGTESLSYINQDIVEIIS